MKEKKKFPTSHIVLLVLVMIPLWIHVFNSLADRPIWERLLSPVLFSFLLVVGSTLAAVAGGFILHYTLQFYYWFFNEEPKETSEKDSDEIYKYIGALWPVAFCVVYFWIVKG